MNSPNDRSIPELFSDAIAQLAKLVGNEFELARTELSEKVTQGGTRRRDDWRRRNRFHAGISPVVICDLGGVDTWRVFRALAYLLTGGAAALVSVALIATGLRRLSGDALKPSMTLDQVQRDKLAAKEMVR